MAGGGQWWAGGHTWWGYSQAAGGIRYGEVGRRWRLQRGVVARPQAVVVWGCGVARAQHAGRGQQWLSIHREPVACTHTVSPSFEDRE